MEYLPGTTAAALTLLSAGIMSVPSAQGQTPAVGLLHYESAASPGYTLFAPVASHTTYLIDMGGRVVNTWTSAYRPALSIYLRENGHLRRTCSSNDGGGAGRAVQEFDWDGTLLWDFQYIGTGYSPHHDIEPLPAEPDGSVTPLDLASCIDIPFSGSPDLHDSGCPSPRFDIDCDGFSTAIDVSKLIDHLFAGGLGPCDPCVSKSAEAPSNDR